MKRSRQFPSLFVALLILLWSSTALASPWTLLSDVLVLQIDQDFQYADREFLSDGTLQSFPLNQVYRAANTRLSARYGFTDRFEGAVDVNFSLVSFTSDPFILADLFAEGSTAGEATNTITNFNTSQAGAADVHFHGRYNLINRAILVTTETSVKLPTGYTPPTPTFVDDEFTTGGQATLGDGQVDLTQKLLFGTYIPPTRTFVRLGAGYRHRFGAPGSQAVVNFKAGQYIGSNLIVMAGAGWTKTVTEGEIIGQTYVAVDPDTQADEYSLEDIDVQDLRLDRDALNLEAGFLVSVDEVELTFNYVHSILGSNTAAVHVFSVGAIFSFPDVTSREAIE